MDLSNLTDPKVIGAIVSLLLGVAYTVSKFTKTKKDDDFIKRFDKEAKVITTLLSGLAKLLLIFRKKK